MPRSHTSSTQVAYATRHVHGLQAMNDPIEPLASAVMRELHNKLLSLGMPGSPLRFKKTSVQIPADLLPADESNLAQTISLESLILEIESLLEGTIASAIKSSLTETSREGKALRMSLISALASVELAPGAALAQTEAPGRSTDGNETLSTAEAAQILGMSRPYVSMLFDAGKLGPVEKTQGGHRRITPDAISKYRASIQAQHAEAPTPQQAGIDADLYEHDDSYFVQQSRSDSRQITGDLKKKTP